VQLEQVDVIDTETVEGAANLLARAGPVALPGLRREEETVAVGGIDVVSPGLALPKHAFTVRPRRS
jgi:hypothetical protein